MGMCVRFLIHVTFPVKPFVSDVFDHRYSLFVRPFMATGSRLVPAPVLIASKGLYGASAVA